MTGRYLLTWCLLSFVSPFFFSSFARAQDEDEDEPYRAGLIGKYSPGESDSSFERVDRSVGFVWGDRSPDRRIPGGAFRVQWRGFLMSQANGPYQLHAYFTGKLRLKLGERVLIDADSATPNWQSSKPLDLSFDFHPLEVDYEKTSDNARISLFWSGPQFQLEPIDGRQLFHDRTQTPDASFERGEQLVRALRCAACHEIAGESESLPAPALDRLAGNLNPQWLTEWLTQSVNLSGAGENESEINLSRRMPHFQMTRKQAEAIGEYLFAKSQPVDRSVVKESATKKKPPEAKKKKKKGDEPPPAPPKTPVEAGRETVLSIGCIACHRIGEIGQVGLFSGSDLSKIAEKRPGDFFVQWLAAPQSINAHHRMPVFELSDEERSNVAAFLATLKTDSGDSERSAHSGDAKKVATGERLFAELRCVACHQGPAKVKAAKTRSKLTANSNWQQACSVSDSKVDRPHYKLTDEDQSAVRLFVSRAHPKVQNADVSEKLVRESNCLSCHMRDDSLGLGQQLTAVAEQHTDLSSLIPAMTPPPLISVGDKLHDKTLRDSVRRSGKAHRPYLMVRMPKFPLSDDELDALVARFVDQDRIPPNAPASIPIVEDRTKDDVLREAIGTRLVTPDGFGCTSCHQLGSVVPAKAPLNARGPDLSMTGERIRREWFDRWVRNPSRIVPRMEMPSVQVPVRGVLNEDLNSQLAMVWSVLNRPGFEPPEPNPVRIVRHTGTQPDANAAVITDVIRTKSGNLIKPLLIGFSNRHNALYDLETARLVSWSIGDVARQRTEGKTWFWEIAGKELFLEPTTTSELSLVVNGEENHPVAVGQFLTEFDSLEHVSNGVRFRHRIHFANRQLAPSGQIEVTQEFIPLIRSAGSSQREGFRRVIEITGVARGVEARFRATSIPANAGNSPSNGKRIQVSRGGEGSVAIEIPLGDDQRFEVDGSLRKMAESERAIRWELEYVTDLPVDHFPVAEAAIPPIEAAALEAVPGFEAVRLPLPDEIMPTALAWQPNGSMFIASLKGQIWLVRDKDQDGLGETLNVFSDDLAAPYGLYATESYVDVLNKYSLLRLFDDDGDGRSERMINVASGWGHTADYHDWAVGLPRDEQGNYFMALPCQQDDRSPAGAKLRGEFLKLTPREPTKDDPRLYAIERISRGHRFPMGIARNRDGEFFVTDNQGNYNPFNELNHIRKGAHFGFINALEKNSPKREPLSPPAINIPHPWTRSVNGICFLDTPRSIGKTSDRKFGPFEGHLIGCEYDTRRLIRMSLEKVGETYQGAAYPFSYDQPPSGPPLLGPITCAVSPAGDLYVGGLRDSGWGGANNIGEVVRLKFAPAQLPNGIAEMKATRHGFSINFIAPVDRQLAAEISNYSLISYTRESTPAYGGPDLNRRNETISAVEVTENGGRVELKLGELRPGYVYELHIKNLAGNKPFFPAEAHYTLLQVP